ncbi:MAG: DUF2189 domain-containing protein [Pseudomonadota bacterium]
MSKPASTADFKIHPASRADLVQALRLGLHDFLQYPVVSAFFGVFYLFLGYAIFYALFVTGVTWAAIPFAIGFPLVAPFVAAGLYDISRRKEAGEPVSFSQVLTVVWQQKGRELGWMAFTVLFVFWIWIYQVRLLIALLLPSIALSSFSNFQQAVLQSSDGWIFLGVGTLVGAVLAIVLFSITVISMPLLMDREVDFVTAMITSVQAVVASPLTMVLWGLTIAALLLLAMIPMLLGMIAVLPILGHASWHLYRRIIQESAPQGT